MSNQLFDFREIDAALEEYEERLAFDTKLISQGKLDNLEHDSVGVFGNTAALESFYSRGKAVGYRVALEESSVGMLMAALAIMTFVVGLIVHIIRVVAGGGRSGGGGGFSTGTTSYTFTSYSSSSSRRSSREASDAFRSNYSTRDSFTNSSTTRNGKTLSEIEQYCKKQLRTHGGVNDRILEIYYDGNAAKLAYEALKKLESTRFDVEINHVIESMLKDFTSEMNSPTEKSLQTLNDASIVYMKDLLDIEKILDKGEGSKSFGTYNEERFLDSVVKTMLSTSQSTITRFGNFNDEMDSGLIQCTSINDGFIKNIDKLKQKIEDTVTYLKNGESELKKDPTSAESSIIKLKSEMSKGMMSYFTKVLKICTQVISFIVSTSNWVLAATQFLYAYTQTTLDALNYGAGSLEVAELKGQLKGIIKIAKDRMAEIRAWQQGVHANSRKQA